MKIEQRALRYPRKSSPGKHSCAPGTGNLGQLGASDADPGLFFSALPLILLPLELRWGGFNGDPAAVMALRSQSLILCVPDRASRHNRAAPAGPQERRKHSRTGEINLVEGHYCNEITKQPSWSLTFNPS